jgi:hypothetical protein
MKLRRVKTEAEARAAMLAEAEGRPMVEFTTKDGNFTALRIGQLHVGFGQYGSTLELSVESPFDKATRYRVTATAQGFPPAVTYHEDWAAAVAKRDSYGDGVTTELNTNQVDVLVDECGTVVRELGTGATGEDVPF